MASTDGVNGHANGTNGHSNGCTNGIDGHSNGSNRIAVFHPLDPLSVEEIGSTASLIRARVPDAIFNSIFLKEPPKSEMQKWNQTRSGTLPRIADIIVSTNDNKVYDALVDIGQNKIIQWEESEGVYPSITMEDLQAVEGILRTTPSVIEQCGIIGIPPEDMHKVYCDPWTIGYDERWTDGRRLQQALMYYRPSPDDNQYTYPLDFCPIYDIAKKEVIHIDVPKQRVQVSKAPPTNWHADAIQKNGGFREPLKPINITQPEGPSFTIKGRELEWQKWKFHVGFNYREGIVLSDVTFNDKGNVRPVFWRISLAEMVVPYGHPGHPHHRKHAFDLGEYGAGYMTNSLTMGCDCKGHVEYMDAAFVNKSGQPYTIKNAICIHEEDDGILFKHTDFRDDSCTVTRARKLIVSQIFTAGNYEYCVYWILHQDGVIQLEIKLTGILSTTVIAPNERSGKYGVHVYPGVGAHNHQHLFCLRLDPMIDGNKNTVVQVDAVAADEEVGAEGNRYGNAFLPRRTKLTTVRQGKTDYAPGRTWAMANTSSINEYSGLPASYMLVSREVPGLLPKPNSLVWNRAGFARHAVHVTRHHDDQIFPAGRHVPQHSGVPPQGLPAWIDEAPEANIDHEDIVLWHTFGVTHFPAPEDYPLMPAEPMTVLLRPRNFFTQNPALDVPPQFSSWATQIRAAKP